MYMYVYFQLSNAVFSEKLFRTRYVCINLGITKTSICILLIFIALYK